MKKWILERPHRHPNFFSNECEKRLAEEHQSGEESPKSPDKVWTRIQTCVEEVTRVYLWKGSFTRETIADDYRNPGKDGKAKKNENLY